MKEGALMPHILDKCTDQELAAEVRKAHQTATDVANELERRGWRVTRYPTTGEIVITRVTEEQI